VAKLLLKDTYVMKLIKETLKNKPEGYILFEQGDEWKKVFFKKGRIINSSSSSSEDYLGQYLLSYGVISNEQFEEAYHAGKEDKLALEKVLKFSTPKILKQMIFEKVIDAVFIAARWPKCKYEVFEEKQTEYKNIDVAITPKDISKGLKKRVDEFRNILAVIPELGARPEINEEKAQSTKINSQKEIILNYLKAGKTITEILSIMAPHNYLLLKSFYQLHKMEIISKGKGAPLSRENAIRIINDSAASKKEQKIVSCFTIDEPVPVSPQSGSPDDRFKREVSIYQKLYNEDPDNSIYNNGFVKAKSCFIVDFYNSKLSPFAVIGLVAEMEKIPLKNDVDEEIYRLVQDRGGKISVRDVVKALESRHEIDVLTSVNKFLINGIIEEVEPETMVDAIRLGRAESFERLFKKEEVNRFFETDISINLTPSMFSVISGDVEEDIAAEVGVKTSGSKVSLHSYEMTFLMLASMLGNYEAAQFLLLNHAKIDLHNGNGVTALMLALENSHDDIAMLLMDHGANVNAKNSTGYSALMIAASKGMAHIVDYMIRLDVDVNQVNINGQSALHSAMRFDHEEIVISLIAAGIDLSTKDKEGHFPLYYAESVEIAELIKKGEGNSKKLKKKIEKRKDALLVYEQNVLGSEEKSLSYILTLGLFSALLVVAIFVNIYLFFFPEDRYGISAQAESAMELLGKDYCGKFKECRPNLPKHVVANCEQMGTDIVSSYYRNAKSCDMKMIKECGACLKTLECDDFLDVDDSNLSNYCHECMNICKFHVK